MLIENVIINKIRSFEHLNFKLIDIRYQIKKNIIY